MRALFIVQYPRFAPSPRYRVYQMIPYLESQGVQCDVASLVSERHFFQMRQSGRLLWKAAVLAGGLGGRIRTWRRLGEYDVVYILKGAFPYGPPVIEWLLARKGVPLLFDFDDAIYIRKRSPIHPALDWLKSDQRAPQIIRLVDQVVVPNDYLAGYAKRFNPSVRVVPEAEDTDRLEIRRPHRNGSERLVIGWIGSPSTVKYLRLIEAPLREICRRHPKVIVQVVGGRFNADGVRVESLPWSLEAEVSLLHGFDIGVMPLPLEEWSKGKSGCKLRQYMATGVPGVATRIGYNCELVQDGRTGVLVESTEEWIDALEKLIENAELRNQIAQEARRDVVSRFSIDTVGPLLLAALEDAATRRSN